MFPAAEAELAVRLAARMFISRRTVTTHLTSIFRKLGISGRTELAAAAIRHDNRGSENSRPLGIPGAR